jgi:hypothetical protein
MIALLIATAAASPVRAEEDGDAFYLRAAAGYSLPMLSALSDELDLQGLGEEVPGGACLDISLGRTLSDKRWAVEFAVSIALYPEFVYSNELEEFRGDMRHYGFGAILMKLFPLRDGSLVPSVGLGCYYGRTDLVSGGGKMAAFEGIALARLEAGLRGNIALLVECTYASGLTEDVFEAPHLENVSGDVVFTSNGTPLEDRFTALEIKIGIIAWLQKRLPAGGP